MLQKTLILIRHAKTQAALPGMSDFERPLTQRGENNAPEMAERLLQQGLTPSRILSSPAVRAISTARLMSPKFDIPTHHIVEDATLYHADPQTMVAAIARTPADVQTLVLVGHNPGISELAAMISDARIEHLPTCAVVAVDLSVNDWAAFEADGTHRFILADWPGAQVL